MTSFSTPTNRQNTPLLSPNQLQFLIDRQEVLLLDVREVAEYQADHIAGSHLYPLSQITQLPLPASDRPIVLTCQSGMRSQKAATQLQQRGLTITELQGGLNAWKQQGLPTIGQTANAPISLMRQVQLVAGSLVLISIILSLTLAPTWLGLSAFVGAGLVFAGLSGTCLLANVLAAMPWNRG
ncbi:rhodanese-like domain-containing protein [Synechococcus elongatus]|uniref:Rhodanese-like n=1 Tax=Synechococcus elongatus (strain ATCC 33912 / PCC 7942 / FACHB-805) TaxID=1140 RepID=Q31PQ3_SYNE7|nr:rhodanese-like domain-containing protein [Synechococcus elongatus]ABB56966.1 Rhodanese-like [Synechococcus elongatus PCC 7942 = FACHB-805]AJD58510.1 rhodanese [Synechococcus elongatus UTEX 2973]MBD2587369.1 rhodanese-like domain-containing protein [Synechococcus elongatus FACHB-242]MBD2688852.1 rhodanese-like domain-containing protein [Synechococcus elongatus FACHB-1061]MBD2707923.1 rhodanese-like domain-containing protein [Synechococcus elongatus PCC 7942 = FACHB-805]